MTADITGASGDAGRGRSGGSSGGGSGGTRRARLRESTSAEILTVARRHVVRSGPGGISLRAIARDMGMTAPALYRYFAGLDDLVEALIADLYDEVVEAMEHARDAIGPDDVPRRLMAVSRTFRRWAVDNPGEFGLLFGSPIPGFDAHDEGPAYEAASRFGGVFAALFADLWARRPFPVPADDEVDPRLGTQLRRYADEQGIPLPLGALQVFVSCWIRLYGTVTTEVFGHMKFAVEDAEPMFELQLRDLGVVLGIADRYEPPDRSEQRPVEGRSWRPD